jgi:hypothetical protein
MSEQGHVGKIQNHTELDFKAHKSHPHVNPNKLSHRLIINPLILIQIPSDLPYMRYKILKIKHTNLSQKSVIGTAVNIALH